MRSLMPLKCNTPMEKKVRPKARNIRLACSDHRPWHSLRRDRASRSKQIRSTEKRARKTTAELDFFTLQPLGHRYSVQMSRRSFCLCRKPNKSPRSRNDVVRSEREWKPFAPRRSRKSRHGDRNPRRRPLNQHTLILASFTSAG